MVRCWGGGKSERSRNVKGWEIKRKEEVERSREEKGWGLRGRKRWEIDEGERVRDQERREEGDQGRKKIERSKEGGGETEKVKKDKEIKGKIQRDFNCVKYLVYKWTCEIIKKSNENFYHRSIYSMIEQ